MNDDTRAAVPRLLIYGANGYTGRLVTQEAVRRGLRPVLAGRSESSVRRVADGFGLEGIPVDLGDEQALAAALGEVDAVLHCAGPFSATAAPMVAACLSSSAHYLDITGEVEVFEAVLGRHREAVEAGVALVPGVGFDVVPTDHVVARLVDELPGARGADVAVISRGGFSRGTLQTAADGLGTGNRVRRAGRLEPVAHAHRTRTLDLGHGATQRVATTPLGDLATAHHGYGLLDVATFTTIPVPGLVNALSPVIERTMRAGPVADLTRRVLGRLSGPSEATRGRSRSTGWAHVWDADGRGLVHAVEVANTYAFTARSMVHAAVTLAANPVAGAFTPAAALGRDFLLSVPGADLAWPLDHPEPLGVPAELAAGRPA